MAAGGGRLLGGFMGQGLQCNSHVLSIVSGFSLPRYHASKNTVTNVQFAQTALTGTKDAKRYVTNVVHDIDG